MIRLSNEELFAGKRAGRGVHRLAHLPETIRRRFSGNLAVGHHVRNPPRRLMACLAQTAKGEVIAFVTEIMTGVFAVHKAVLTTPGFFQDAVSTPIRNADARLPGNTAGVFGGRFSGQKKEMKKARKS